MNTNSHAGSAIGTDLAGLTTYPSPHGTLVRLADVKCALARATPQHSVTERASIDSDPKFQQLAEYWRGEPYGTRSFENAWAELVAHIDSRAQPLASTAATQPEQASIRRWEDRAAEKYPAIPMNKLAPWAKLVEAKAEIRDLRAALAIPASTAASEQQASADWISDVVRDVAELPDRDSPADWPNAMLVTADELRAIIERHATIPSEADERASWFEGAEDCDGNPLVTVRADELKAAIKFICIASLASHRVDGDMLSRDEFAKRLAARAALTRRATTATPGLLDEILSLAEQGMCHGLTADDFCSEIVAKIKALAAAPDIATTAADQQGVAQLPQSDPRSDPKIPQSEGAAQAQAGASAEDAVVEANRKLLLDRSRVGIGKYGTTLAAAGLSRSQIAQHALEEALDLANYLQTIIQSERAAMAAPATSNGGKS